MNENLKNLKSMCESFSRDDEWKKGDKFSVVRNFWTASRKPSPITIPSGQIVEFYSVVQEDRDIPANTELTYVGRDRDCFHFQVTKLGNKHDESINEGDYIMIGSEIRHIKKV